MACVYPPDEQFQTNNPDSTRSTAFRDIVGPTSRFHPYRLRDSDHRNGNDSPTRPCPLSCKRLIARATSADMDLGPLQVYRMPAVHLEVWPRVDDPLPELVRPYLKSVLPFERLTEQWVNFAVSTLQKPSHRLRVLAKAPLRRGRITVRNVTEKDDDDDIAPDDRNSLDPKTTATASFIFDIPYANDQNLLLVRKRRDMQAVRSKKDAERLPNAAEDAAITFDRHVNADDADAVAVARALQGMIESVAISCAENSASVDDPDADCERRRRRLADDANADGCAQKRKADERGVAGTETFRKEKTGSGGLRRELKRLNATIIDDYVAPVKGS